MFFHNFKYALKTLLKNKTLIFWTFAFPIILGTFFQMAFSDIEKNEMLDIIPIGIVETDYQDPILKEAFVSLSEEQSEEQLFNIFYAEETEAQQLLEDSKIIGYVLLEESPKVVIQKNGIEATILKTVVEEVLEMETVAQNIVGVELSQLDFTEIESLDTFYMDIYQKILKIKNQNDTSIEDISRAHLSYTMIEFYTLIAMACLYGGILGMVAINRNLANMSANGKRIAVSPIPKTKLIFSSALASYLVQLMGLFLLFLYTILVLKVDYGNQFLFIVLLALVGSFAGLSLGILISCLFKTNENTKTGILIAITMLGCFFSGMMGITMKYIIDKNIPILNLINPASMITDGFYALYYYDTLNRYWFNIGSLLLFVFFMIALSIFELRRQKYDSI